MNIVKEINAKNRTYNFFNCMIIMKNVDLNKIMRNKKLYKNITDLLHQLAGKKYYKSFTPNYQ